MGIPLKGKVIWLYGESRTGKTTLGYLLGQRMAKTLIVRRLDEDILGETICKGLDNTRKGICDFIRKAGYLARILANEGLTVIASFITPYLENRLFLYKVLKEDLILIRLDASIKTLMDRDENGLYTHAILGNLDNVAGVHFKIEDDPFTILRVFTDDDPPDKCADLIIATLRSMDYEC
jgi:adenylylsulfate kinase